MTRLENWASSAREKLARLIRQMLVDLQKQDYISTSKSGYALTENGERLMETRLKALQIVEINPLDIPILKAGQVSLVYTSKIVPTKSTQLWK